MRRNNHKSEMLPMSDTRLEEAKRWLRVEFKNGRHAICPCCEQIVALRTRRLGKRQAKALALLYRWDRRQPNQVLHVERYCKKERIDLGHDWQQLSKWNFIECPDKGSGRWRITDTGVAFVEGNFAVKDRFYQFNSKTFWPEDGWPGPYKMITFEEALEERFNLLEILNPIKRE